MVCLGLMTIMTPDYSYAALCHALAGLSYGLCFGLTLPPTDKAGVYDWSITSIIRSR